MNRPIAYEGILGSLCFKLALITSNLQLFVEYFICEGKQMASLKFRKINVKVKLQVANLNIKIYAQELTHIKKESFAFQKSFSQFPSNG